MTDRISIVGAGPTGALLAILLQRRGQSSHIDLFESRPDPGLRGAESGRSINLALADRGIHALKTAGVFDGLGASLLPMRGRLLHAQDGSTSFHRYGQKPNEEIYSISRHKLNQGLLRIAAGRPGITVHFEHKLAGLDFARGTAQIHDLRRGLMRDVPMSPLLATDGAGSLVRRHMSDAGLIEAHETDLEHGYKELSIPCGPDGKHRLLADALHIWPRGNFMLIALPNEDGSFTATLFLARHGPSSFDSLRDDTAIDQFLSDSFPDARDLMPDCVTEFKDHPIGFLGTVAASPWHHGGTTALIGDAAHAIVPFHGQGMNCCFEDCIEFLDCVDRLPSWEAAFAQFSSTRKPNTDAIAAMAIENYLEMRERVAEPKFQLQRELALQLETRHPRQFIPRYSMVMFHHEIPYQVALQRGAVQSRILAELTEEPVATLAQVDFERAREAINRELPPVASVYPT